MQILNIAGYKFIALNQLAKLREGLLHQCSALNLKGTILLSNEGININLCGEIEPIRDFIDTLKLNPHFQDIRFHETFSTFKPFRKLKVKIKKEIISLRQPNINPAARAPHISPQDFKRLMDNDTDMVILDTRNKFEVEVGTFIGATHLNLKDFSQLPTTLHQIERNKPIVMFCTGGIRCEKAALYLLNQGFKSVYQLDGGIIGYFANVGGTHYTGNCFVFDDRLAIDQHLQPVTNDNQLSE